MFHSKLENEKKLSNEIEKKEIKSKINFEDYTLQYLYNTNNTFFQLFMHTKVYDKLSNENLEKQGILLRSWNPITKKGEKYVFNKEDGEGDLNTKIIYYPSAKTIFEISLKEGNEKILNLAREIMNVSPHNDIEIKYTE
ncbi:MAG TPA: hypothetical protein VEW92_06520 [Nitrososphaeraceae archaeon]|jgi:hypothetical protein|nr:hypothetical protein [Nitrososphaeraceae archaeon]